MKSATSPLNVIVLHGYSDSNKGDLAIVVGMVTGIRQVRPGCRIVLQSVYSESDPDFNFHHRFVRNMGIQVQQMSVPSPYVDTASHSAWRNFSAFGNLMISAIGEWCVRWIPGLDVLFPRQAAALKSMKDSDIVLLKGGQYIYNDQGGVRGLLYLWRILHPIFIARRLARDVVLLGQSVGPLVDARGRRMAARALGLCTRLVVREKRSATLLTDLGLGEQVCLAPDFAFLIDPKRPDASNPVLAQIETGQWLGVTVVNWSFPDADDPSQKRSDYLQALVAIAKEVHLRTGLGLALFPQVTVQHHGESDLDLLRRYAFELVQAGIPHVIVEDDLAPAELSYLYGRCQALLGTRLHSCILAACSGTPVIAIRYQGFKTEGIMAELGLDDMVYDIAEMKPKQMADSICDAVSRREEISNMVIRKVSEFRQSLIAVLEGVLPK